MKVYVILKENNFIDSYSMSKLDDRFIEIELPEEEFENFQWNFIHYTYDGKLIYHSERAADEQHKAELTKELYDLKNKLQEEDYKIIKCYEAQLVNQEVPYDVQNLIYKRNEFRNRINEIEGE